jgi:hypothetical protein
MVRLAVVLALALALTPACGSADTSGATGSSRRVVVPQVVGLSRSRAECRLHAAGLRWRLGAQRTPQSKPLVPCGRKNVHVLPDPTVRRQRPPRGYRVRRGSVVALEDACTLLRFHSQPAACG